MRPISASSVVIAVLDRSSSSRNVALAADVSAVGLGKAAQQLGKLFRESSEFGDLVLPVYFQVTRNRRGSDARQKLAALVANPGLPAVDALD
jgi:hypothetical protein